MKQPRILKIKRSQYEAIRELNLACGKVQTKTGRYPQGKFDEGIKKIFNGGTVDFENTRFEIIED
jgi:hypothetical protein